jgi:UDP-glucuronate 4-epimerase
MYKEVQFHPQDVSLKDSVFLVTGGAGFIGSHIVEYLLSHGAGKVKVLDNLSEGRISNLDHLKLNPALEFTEGDCCNTQLVKSLMEGVQYVSHQAALGSVPRSIKTPLATNEANVTGFLNVLNAAREAGVKQMVYASSSSVYGANTKIPFSEHDSTDHPLLIYAASKKSNELMAHTYSYLYNLPTTGLRFFTVYGPWGRPDMALFKFTKAILEDKPIDVFNYGNHSRDFTYIDDVILAIAKIAVTFFIILPFEFLTS